MYGAPATLNERTVDKGPNEMLCSTILRVRGWTSQGFLQAIREFFIEIALCNEFWTSVAPIITTRKSCEEVPLSLHHGKR